MVPTLSIPQVSLVYKLGVESSQLRNIGSTGKPKGVDVTHRNVTNLLTIAPGNLGIKPGTKVAQLLSISFDMGRLPMQRLNQVSNPSNPAAWEILGTLMNGGTLCIRGSDWNKTLKKVAPTRRVRS